MKHDISDTQVAIFILIIGFLICGGLLAMIKIETKYTLGNSWKIRDEVYDVYKQLGKYEMKFTMFTNKIKN